jgi:hypothetical protein
MYEKWRIHNKSIVIASFVSSTGQWGNPVLPEENSQAWSPEHHLTQNKPEFSFCVVLCCPVTASCSYLKG